MGYVAADEPSLRVMVAAAVIGGLLGLGIGGILAHRNDQPGPGPVPDPPAGVAR